MLRWTRYSRTRIRLKYQLDNENLHEILEVLFIVIMVFFYSHVAGCMFYFIGSHESSPERWILKATWDDNGSSQPISTAPLGEAYLASLYWAVVTVTSVGYGDIIPSNTIFERLFAIVNGFGSAVVLGYVIGGITNMIFTRLERGSAFQDRMHILQLYLEEEKVPDNLAQHIVQQLMVKWDQQLRKYSVWSLVEDIPEEFQTDLKINWWTGNVKSSNLFSHDHKFLRAIFPLMTELHLKEGSVILKFGEKCDYVYVVRKGTVKVQWWNRVENEGEIQTDVSAGAPHSELGGEGYLLCETSLETLFGTWTEDMPDSGTKEMAFCSLCDALAVVDCVLYRFCIAELLGKM